MTQLLDPPGTVCAGEPEILPPVLAPDRLEPPTHPALPRLRTGRLRFAPAPVQERDELAVLARSARRMDWVERLFEASWMTLLLACAAECIYRLLWAIQP